MTLLSHNSNVPVKGLDFTLKTNYNLRQEQNK